MYGIFAEHYICSESVGGQMCTVLDTCRIHAEQLLSTVDVVVRDLSMFESMKNSVADTFIAVQNLHPYEWMGTY